MSQTTGKKYVSKRKKVKTVPFEMDESFTAYKRRSTGGGSEAKVLLFQRNEFLAVRNDTDGFFLCRALQHIYEATKRFSIQWLEQDAQDENAYDLAYTDTLDPECILTDVRLKKVNKDKYTLPLNQRQRVEKALAKSVEGRDSSDEDESDSEPPKKKAKLDSSSKRLKRNSSTKAKAQKKSAKGSMAKKGSLKKKTSSVVVAAKGIKKRVLKKPAAKGSKAGKKSETGKAAPARKGKGKGVLIPRSSIKVLEKDPMLHSKEKVPFVSSLAHSKLLLRAVTQDDLKLLKELIADRNHVAKLDIIYSDGFDRSPLDVALEHGNMAAITLLCKELFAKQDLFGKQGTGKVKERVALPTSLLRNESVGQYNKLALHGVPFIRKLNMSRGSKEGNNAFTKDLENTDRGGSWESYLSSSICEGLSKTLLDKFCALTGSPAEAKNHCFSCIHYAVQYGHRKLAAELIEDVSKTGLTNFNFLHRDVLAFDKEELKSGIREASVKKAPFDNQKVTPMHCAAINPNPKYLSQLLAILPDYNIMDSGRRRLIHYAVACEGTGPLQLLLDRNVNFQETDSQGATPLFTACVAGRLHNVKLLLAHAKQAAQDIKKSSEKSKGKKSEDDEEEALPPPAADKFGLCGINMGVSRPHNELFSYTPLHIAAQYGNLDIVKVLLEYGADINKELSASKNKLTPLMLAAAHTEMEVMRLLIKHGAKVSQKDKLKRTPLMLAAMNGHAHIVSFLLSLGCSPNDQDSSGNTALHYAAGYGWYFCVKILLEAGANPSAGNDWKTTPLAVAFLKGHVGLADILLEQPSVDINFRLDGGMTLVHMACSSSLEEGIVEQLEYLVVKKSADCTLMDDSNANALHHLTQNKISLHIRSDGYVQSREETARSVKMAEMLLQRGCDASAKDANGMTPLMFAIQMGNQPLVELLVKNGAGVSNTLDKENRNVLHFLSQQCMNQPMAEILTLLHKTSGESGVLEEMGKQVDTSGMTPLICACHAYSLWNGDLRKTQVQSWNFSMNQEARSPRESEAEDSSSVDDDKDEEDANEDEEVDQKEEKESADEDNEGSDPGDKEGNGDLEMEVDESDVKKEKDKNDQAASTAATKILTEKEIIEQRWEAGRNYIQTLIEVCGNVTDVPLQKKLFKSTDPVPEKLEDQYFKKSVAGFSVVHFLVDASGHEASATLTEGGVSALEYCPGLSVVLNHLKTKSDAEQYDCFGRTPLLHAIAEKRTKAAEKLIKYGVDVNCKSRDKDTDGFSTALVLAARHGLHGLFSVLLQHGANVNEKDANSTYTALHYVIKSPVTSCFKQVVESLVTYKASVTEADKNQKTALHLLMEYSRGHSDAVAVAGLLLSAGASIDACDRKGRTPLHLAVNANSGDVNTSTEMEQFLLDKGANQFARDWLQRLPLHYVFVKIGKHTVVSPMDPVELCSTLTSSTNKPSSMVNYGDQFGLTPLHVAARRGAGVCCLHLIKKGSNVNGRDFDGNTPLALAIANKHESCTILLLQQNADISGNIVIVPSPPHEKAEKDTENADKTKPEKKEKPEWKWKHLKHTKKPLEIKTFSIFQGVVSQDWQGIIFLMLDLLEKFSLNLLSVVQAALVTQKYHLALMLIRKARGKNELTGKMEYDQNLAHVLAKSSTSTTDDKLITVVAQMLFDKGVLFDVEDEYGCTPLHYACLQGNKPLLLFILENCKKINLEKKDKLGRTAMAAAFWKLGHPGSCSLQLVTVLHEHGATLDLLCSYPSQQIFMFGHKRELEEEDYLRSTASNPLVSPLMLSIIHHNFDLTRQLIERGASVNFADLEGRTPLMVAVYENNVHLVRLLLDLSYVQTGNDDDEFPVEQSASSGQPKQRSRKAFALARKLNKLPSLQGNVAEATGATSKLNLVNGLNMSAKIYPMTSSVNAKALDCQGRSALHYLIQPQLNGSYDNYRLLQQLVAIGAPLEQADKDGKTVMDYAMAQGLTKLATTVQYLLDKEKVKSITPKFAESSVHDGITWDSPAPDFVRDSDEFIEKFEKNLATEEGLSEIEYKAVPDSHLSEFTTGQVLIDTDLNLPYDVLLTKIDVAAGQWGLYNFYKMQIVHQKGKDLYILFTRWGRIGDSGNFQQTPFPHQDDAVKEFRKIFRAKTSNDWPQANSNFEPKPRKYRLVALEQRSFGRKAVDIFVNLENSSLPSKLHPYVQDMIKELTDVTMLANSMDKLGIDRQLVPLGRLNKEMLNKAKEILVNLKTLVKTVEKMRSEIAITDMDKYGAELEKIASLTNEYYHLLPKAGFEYERIPILDNTAVLESEWKNVEALMEIEIASKIIIGAEFSIKETNPLDYVYRCLKCQVRLMDENETETQYLLRYISATWNGKVEAIFRISREGEEQRLASCGVNNHRLLFHGSSSSNLISILSKGLLISPPDAPSCGSAFGNGIYTADRFSKSHGYCFNYSYSNSKVKYMLVCEVALGKTKDIGQYEYQEKLPAGFQSVRGVGQKQPDPQYDLTLPTGAVIPLGATKTHHRIGDQPIYLSESEYIVYKEDQACLRYLIQFIS